VVQAILVEEERTGGGLMALDVLRDIDDIAASAESAALGMVNEDDPDVRVVAPFNQCVGHVADHLPVKAVQRLGPIEAEPAGEAFPFCDDVLCFDHRIHHGIIA